MRTFLRFVVVGMLVVSCDNDLPSVPPCMLSGDTIFALSPDSLRLPVGAADRPYLEWRVDNCLGEVLSPVTAEWVGPDTSITGFEGPSFGTVTLVARAPGRTFVVVTAGAFVDSMPVIVPDTVPMPTVAHLGAGGDASCAVDVGGVARCWGGGSVLGNPNTSSAIGTCFGAWCSPMPVARTTGASSVQLGALHACSLDAAGSARCWGGNEFGQLGSSPGLGVVEPNDLSGALRFTALALGSGHTCGVSVDGAGYCWGTAEGGRLGTGVRTGVQAPLLPVMGGLLSISARGASTCAVTVEGHIYCWGILSGYDAPLLQTERCEVGREETKLGTGNPIYGRCAFTPLRMPIQPFGADTLFAEVAGACALTTLGSVYCAGDAAVYGYAAPGQFASIVAGGSHTCALTAAGAAWCWGSGRLGDGTSSSSPTPVPVTGGHVFTQLAAGRAHTCGLTSLGEVWCWGENAVGQVGAPAYGPPLLAPVKVRGQA